MKTCLRVVVLWCVVHAALAFHHGSTPIAKRGLSALRMAPDKRIVITGLGIVSPSGNTVQKFYDNVFNGVSAVSKLDRFDPSRFKCQIAAQIRDFEAKTYFKSKKRIKQNDLSCQYA